MGGGGWLKAGGGAGWERGVGVGVGVEWARTAQLLQTFPLVLGERGFGGSGGWSGAGRWEELGQPRVSVPRAVCLPLPSPVLQNEPWELENPMLARTLMEAFQLDSETLASEAAARAANVARAASSNRAARAAAAAARATYSQVVPNHSGATDQASAGDPQPMTYAAAAEARAATPERGLASPHSSQMLANSERAAPGAPAASSPQPQTSSQAQGAATEGPSTACAFPQAPGARDMDATRPKAAFLGQNDVFDFTQPAGVSGMAFPRPKRPAPAQEAAPEGPSGASGGAQAASAGEGAATRPKTTKSGKALAKTRWVEPQNVAAAAAAKAKMATSIPEPEGAAATSQQSAEPWARMGGKRTKKVSPPCCCLQPPLLPCFLCPLLSLPPWLPSPPLFFSQLVHVPPRLVS